MFAASGCRSSDSNYLDQALWEYSDKKWKDRTCPLPKLRLNRKRENTHTQNTLDGTDLGTGLAASVPSNAIYDEHIACCTCRTCALVECAPHVLLQGESAKRPVRPPRPALLRSLEVQQSFCEGHCIVDHRGMSPDKSKTIWNQINQIAIYYIGFLGCSFFHYLSPIFPYLNWNRCRTHSEMLRSAFQEQRADAQPVAEEHSSISFSAYLSAGESRDEDLETNTLPRHICLLVTWE